MNKKFPRRNKQYKTNNKRKLSAIPGITESNNGNQKKFKGSGSWTASNGLSAMQLMPKSPSEKKQVEVSRRTIHRLSDDEYAKVKQRKKEHDKMKLAWPRIFLGVIGDCSDLNLSANKRSSLYMGDIQSILMCALLGNKSPTSPRWARVLRTKKISHVVTVVVEGMSLDEVTTNEDSQNVVKDITDALPRTSSVMQFKLELLAPSKYNAGPLEELLNIPLSKTSERSLKADFTSLDNARESGQTYLSYASIFPGANSKVEFKKKLKADNDKDVEDPMQPKFDRLSLLLSPQDMYEHNYPSPVPGSPGYQDPEFMFTHENYSEVKASSPMFAVDCEMCLTTIRQNELTSISIVNENLELVYHKLVKPRNRIINYLTQYSGITQQMLANVTTTLQDVQQDLKKLLPPDAILVGHSLNGDLKSIKMMHPYVIDSSLAYNLTYIRKKRSSLKVLSKLFLGEVIQDSVCGHDPTEDAGASLKLIQLKLKHDITFGDVILGGKNPNDEDQQEQEPAVDYKREAESYTGPTLTYVSNLFQHAETLRVAFLTTTSCLENYGDVMSLIGKKVSHLEVLSCNKELSLKAAEVSMNVDFTYVHMQMNTKLRQNQAPETRQHHFKKLDKQLQRLYNGAAAKALILYIFSGSSLDVAAEQRANGFVMFAIKGQPYAI